MPRKRKDEQNSQTTAAELLTYVERVARLEDEKAGIAGDIKDVKAEAASRGFDKKVLAQMVREYRMDAADRAAQREHESLCEVYRAALGMLDGTPLGDAARKRLDPEEDAPDEPDEADGDEAPSSAPTSGAMSEAEIGAAKEEGGQAAERGERIFANPYVAGDPRRPAWDEGWCQHTGSDGMEIPKAWRRTPKKPGDGDGAGASS